MIGAVATYSLLITLKENLKPIKENLLVEQMNKVKHESNLLLARFDLHAYTDKERVIILKLKLEGRKMVTTWCENVFRCSLTVYIKY